MLALPIWERRRNLDESKAAERLVLAIVQSSHAGTVQTALLDNKFRVTRINTAGGFLRRGNVTLLVGVASEQVDDVIEIIREHTPHTDAVEDGDPEVATMLFVLPVARFARI